MTTHAHSDALLARLGIPVPILQAPMAGISTPELAAAVTEAGALGALGLGSSGASAAREAIARLRSLTDGPVHLNVFCHEDADPDPGGDAAWLAHLAPEFAAQGIPTPDGLRNISPSFVHDADMQALLLEARPALASFHFGLPPARILADLRAAGILTAATATSPAEAAAIAEAGVDAIIAQGFEAGGHRGIMRPDGDDERLSTRELLARIAPGADRPVIAAGGAMTGADIRELLGLGAAAVQLGTAFVACPESAADDVHRARLAGGSGADALDDPTVMTTAISGRPARGFRTRLTALGEEPGAPAPAAYPRAYDAAKQLHAAAKARGDGSSYPAHWAGTGALRSRALPAAELVHLLAEELAAA